MRWTVKSGDILDVAADVLICSANPFLKLSGGVGGALLLRYGDDMQQALWRYLSERNLRHVPAGEVVRMEPCDTPYTAVLHAVAVDGFYHTTPEIVSRCVCTALELAGAEGATTVALTALACGYGPLRTKDFGEAIADLLTRDFPPIRDVIICVRNKSDADELAAALPGVIRE